MDVQCSVEGSQRHQWRVLIGLLLAYIILTDLFNYLLTYLLTCLLACLLACLLTPRSTVLLEKLTGLQLIKKSPTFYGTRRFITTVTRAHHLSLSWARWIQFMPLHPISWRSIIILSSICTWISHYVVLRFFYLIACFGAVILSFNKGKLLFYFITISCTGLYILFILEVWIICLFTFEFYHLVLLDCQLILKTVISPEDKNSFLVKHLLVCFILDSGVIHISDVSHVTPLSKNSTVELNL